MHISKYCSSVHDCCYTTTTSTEHLLNKNKKKRGVCKFPGRPRVCLAFSGGHLIYKNPPFCLFNSPILQALYSSKTHPFSSISRPPSPTPWPSTRNTHRSLLAATLRLATSSPLTTTATVVKRASSLARVSTLLADKSSKSNSKPQTKSTKHGTPPSPASGGQSPTPGLSLQNSAPLSAEFIGDRISQAIFLIWTVEFCII